MDEVNSDIFIAQALSNWSYQSLIGNRLIASANTS
jgi:hypothetical protein